MNTRDPRDPRDPKDPDYRETRVYRAAETRPGLRWLYWAIPLALVLLALPFIFRGQRETVPTRTAAVEQRQLACSTSVYLSSGSSTLTDTDQQKLAQCVSSARQNGSSIAVTGSREGADAVRQALVSQGVPDSSIRVSEAATGDPGRVDVTLR